LIVDDSPPFRATAAKLFAIRGGVTRRVAASCQLKRLVDEPPVQFPHEHGQAVDVASVDVLACCPSSPSFIREAPDTPTALPAPSMA